MFVVVCVLVGVKTGFLRLFFVLFIVNVTYLIDFHFEYFLFAKVMSKMFTLQMVPGVCTQELVQN